MRAQASEQTIIAPWRHRIPEKKVSWPGESGADFQIRRHLSRVLKDELSKSISRATSGALEFQVEAGEHQGWFGSGRVRDLSRGTKRGSWRRKEGPGPVQSLDSGPRGTGATKGNEAE